MASVDSAPSIVLRTLPATPISEIRSSFDNSTAAISAPSILNMAGESHPATPPHSTIQFPQDAPHPSSIKRSSSPTRHSRLSAKPLHLGVRRDVSTMSVDSATSLDTTYHGPVIPPNSDRTYGRTLILAFDGTGDAFDLDNSNVVKLFSVLKKGDNARQLVYYQVYIELCIKIRASTHYDNTLVWYWHVYNSASCNSFVFQSQQNA